MKIEGADFFVRVVPFPNFAADGLVVSNGDGTTTLIVNANTSYEKQKEAMQHEKTHIESDDLYRSGDVMEMECHAG